MLLEIAKDPEVRLRDVAATARITERAAQGIVSDLEAAGYLTRTRVGRRNRYTVNTDSRFRHPNEADRRISGLLALFIDRFDGGTRPAGAQGAAPDGPAAPSPAPRDGS
ncbi:PaaX family transcriptional regulator [Streptantibioticus cattleyicolor NRRL 8057 = DSM 46488]|uniref:PaaX family transcriptional regulator n=1 Tax=Streptantibioticus cattleyicolor (strain ATCC 35852 / DSM 46488 / JCM 4925 / NBRC 14057 / NRRL 8057) TaxID=1003195 RepID=G8WVR1_STREN|nr:PaaX family transcriptional regulator [Streptantibioticus cattleyicolor NRRL 8057 = DSM 46488]